MKHLLLTTIAAVVLVGCGPFFFVAHEVIVPQNFSIHKAARVGHIKAIKRNLASGTDVNAKNEDGVTPLLVAAVSGRKEIIELLIREGADVNAKVNGVTPLHQAAFRSHKEIAELLIANGADLNAVDNVGKFGRTPLDWTFGKTEIADLLRKHGGKTGEELKAEGK